MALIRKIRKVSILFGSLYFLSFPVCKVCLIFFPSHNSEGRGGGGGSISGCDIFTITAFCTVGLDDCNFCHFRATGLRRGPGPLIIKQFKPLMDLSSTGQ